MSIRIMTLVWDNFTRGGSDKLALLAMADWCNDQGGSLHPSVVTVAKKINRTEKQAREILHRLISDGWISVVGNENGGNPGQSRQYQINLEKLLTPPASVTPHVNVTPPASVRDPSRQRSFTPPASVSLNTIEPPIEPPIKTQRKKCADDFDAHRKLIDLNVTDSVARDFIAIRKKKGAPLTATALTGIKREAEKAGITVNQALEKCCLRGWQGFEAAWLQDHGAPPRINGKQSNRDNYAAQAAAAQANLNIGGQHDEHDITDECARVA